MGVNQKQSVAKELLSFSIPLVLSGVLHQLYDRQHHSGKDGKVLLSGFAGFHFLCGKNEPSARTHSGHEPVCGCGRCN